jgi:ribonuclease P protein component
MLAIKYRLKLNRDFDKIFKTGHSYYGRFVGVKIINNEKTYNRYAVLVGKKIEKSAVKRNLIKRKTLNIIKIIDRDCHKGFDCVIIVLSNKIDDFNLLNNEIIYIFKKLKLLS